MQADRWLFAVTVLALCTRGAVRRRLDRRCRSIDGSQLGILHPSLGPFRQTVSCAETTALLTTISHAQSMRPLLRPYPAIAAGWSRALRRKPATCGAIRN